MCHKSGKATVLCILALVSIVGLVSACQHVTASPVVSPLSPLAGASLLSAPPTPWLVPTPSPGMGVVIGRLVANDPTARVGLSIFLGDVVNVGDGSHVAFLNRQNAPIGRVDTVTGRFVFVDVPPGEYSLIVSDVELGGRAYLGPSGDVQVIKVIADQITDLGDISVGP